MTTNAASSGALENRPWPREALFLGGFIALTLGVAAIGSVFTSAGVDGWYETLEKPAFNPPSWVFGPVWTTLYILMAVAAWLIWRPAGFAAAVLPLTLWSVQLGLNLLWSMLFFALEQPGIAVVELVVLWAAIAATALAFWPRSRLAAALLVPYLAWVAFAGVLNFEVWRLN